VGLSDGSLLTLQGNEVFDLAYFYDEHLGHYLWHVGVLGLVALAEQHHLAVAVAN
jgi:hypothetical protein